MPGPDPLLAALAIGIGSLVQGYVGFGMALVAVPLLSMIDPAYVPGPVIANGLLLTLIMGIREMGAVRVDDLRWLLPGAIAGSVLGALILLSLQENIRSINVMTGILVLVAVCTSLFHSLRSKLLVSRTLFSAGVLSGFMGTCSAVGGPPVAILYQNEEGQEVRATLSVYFIFSTLIAIAVLGSIGKFTFTHAALSLHLVPGTIAGFLLSSVLTHHIGDQFLKTGILALSGTASALLILKNLW